MNPGPGLQPHLLRLYRHLAWADARVLELLRSDPPPDALALFSHVLAAERVWLARLRGEDAGGLEIWPEWTVEECAATAGWTRRELLHHVESLTAEELAGSIVYRNSEGREFRTARADVLAHVAMHGSYHRGQIARAVRGAGGEPVNTDFITWVREQPG